MTMSGGENLGREQGGWRAEVLRTPGREREECERQLVERGVPIPLTSRIVWARARPSAGSWFLAVRDPADRCVGGFAIEVHRSRALPGQLLLRCERLGKSLPACTGRVAMQELAHLARRERRVLRVTIEVFARDAEIRDRLAAELAAVGFRRLSVMRGYPRTISIDLAPDEEGILASFSRSTRQNIRAIGKLPVSVRPIEDLALAARMDELMRETLSRTGGEHRASDWATTIMLSHAEPGLSRLVGLFHDELEGPAALLAFAWGCAHGDYAHYDAGASTRATRIRIPLAYPLIWDLIRWAKAGGCQWFDLGGVTAGHHGSDDPVGGISDFKRYFSKRVVEVGQEWVLEPRAALATLAHVVSAGAGWLPRVGRRSR